MRKLSFLLLSMILPFIGCHKKSANSDSAFTGEVRMVTPFAQPPELNGQLFLSKGRLRVELGPMVTVYMVNQQKGWQMFPQLKQYVDVGEKQVSTYLPHLANGSPCPNSERPTDCQMVGRETAGGRQATKWRLLNQHSEPVYLWTDDQLGITLRLEVENVTHQVSRIHETNVADNLFELPAGYTEAPETVRRMFGSSPK